MAIYDDSRYLQTPMYTRIGSNTPILKIRSRHTFNSENYTVYEWRVGDTIAGVSQRQYGNSELYWAILDANPKYRTEFEISSGDLINIPSYEEVVSKVNV